MDAIRKYWDEEHKYKCQHNLKIDFKRNCYEEFLLNEK